MGDDTGSKNTKAERNWAMACHLAALAVFLKIPFGNILGPLVVWLIKRRESSFVDDQGKEALNFQISVTIYFLVLAVPVFLGWFILSGFLTFSRHGPAHFSPFGVSMFLSPWLLMVAVGIFDLVFVILAAIRTSEGQAYRYPLSIKFIK